MLRHKQPSKPKYSLYSLTIAGQGARVTLGISFFGISDGWTFCWVWMISGMCAIIYVWLDNNLFIVPVSFLVSLSCENAFLVFPLCACVFRNLCFLCCARIERGERFASVPTQFVLWCSISPTVLCVSVFFSVWSLTSDFSLCVNSLWTQRIVLYRTPPSSTCVCVCVSVRVWVN